MELGYRGTELRRKLVAAVLRGDKIATASLREEYVPHTDEPLPELGERDEGEGFETLEQWRSAHERAWSDREIADDTLIVCEWFTLIERY